MIGLSQSNFIFGDVLEESGMQDKQISEQKAEQFQDEIVNHIKKHPPTLGHKNYSSKLILVKPTKEQISKDEKQDLQYIQLSKKKYVEMNKNTHPNINHENLIFPYEQSQQIQQEPQSSIRKLYKAMKREQSQIKYGEEIKQQITEKHSHLYQEQQLQQEDIIEEMEKKIEIRSKSLRKLILFKIPEAKLIKCLIKIANDSFFSLQTVFHFYLVHQKQLLMTARKKRFRISSKYQIYAKQKSHIEKIAVARSNYSRTQYKLLLLNKAEEEKQESTTFSSGIIKINKVEQIQKELIYLEQQKCYLSYYTNFLGLSQQKVEIIKPRKNIPKSDRFSDIKSTYQNCEYQRVQKFGNRFAQRDKQGKLILDFKDQNITYSSRNMIVENEFGAACLVFGKRRDDIFIINVMHPFNFLQSFFIAICSLDRKLFVN